MKAVLYIHGKGGNASESSHYEKLFRDCKVIGLDYRTFTPWETGKEIHDAVIMLKEKYDGIILIANSIGAFFSMNAGIEEHIRKAFFISPVLDMEKLICGMMKASGVSENELSAEGVIHTPFGEDLSWDYLCYVREYPIKWNVPTEILYGDHDVLTSFDTVQSFAKDHNANVTVIKGGEHWFHTEDQMLSLDSWIKSSAIM